MLGRLEDRPGGALAVIAAAALFTAATPFTASADASAEPPASTRRAATCKVLFAGPLSGPLAKSGGESLHGVRTALAHAETALLIEGSELVEFDDGDLAKQADAACEAAKKQKVDLIVAAATGVTVDAYVTKARKHGLPLLLVGSAGPASFTLEADEPVSWLGTGAVEQAIVIGNFLEVPCGAKRPGFIVEETARGKELYAALERNLKARFTLGPVLFVAPHAALAPEAMAPLAAAEIDRLVLVGEPDLTDAVADACAQAQLHVPLFLADGMVSGAATVLHLREADQRLADAFLLDGQPRLFVEPHPTLKQAWNALPEATVDAPVPPRMRRAFDFTLTWLKLLMEAGRKPKLGELMGLLRDVRYGADESERPLLDPTLRSARQLWTPWRLSKSGPVAHDPRRFYDPDFGPLLRVRPVSLYAAQPGTKVVHVWFGDAYSKAPRTIEKDLAELGLITNGYDGEFDRWILDELLTRTLGKLSKLFLREEDGTPIPGISWNISFTNVKPEGLKESEYWRAVIAGDDSAAGGRAWPGEGRCEIYSTFMMRTIFRKDALVPPIKGEDKRFLDGKYKWASSTEENLRIKTVRSLIDGYAGSFALTGAHEIGHLIGLGHDESDPRSIMNVVEGAGLRETSACWIPEHVETIDRVLGRWTGKEAKKKR